jgi:hypothetical protein
LFDARPQQPQRAEFRHGEKLIGIGAEPEQQRRGGNIQRDAAGFQGAQIGDRDRKREGKFLGFRSTGVVDGAAVRQRKRSLETAAHQVADRLCERPLHFRPRCRRRAAHGHGAQRLIVEADIDFRRIETFGLDEVGEVQSRILTSKHRNERDRDPGIEKHPIEHPRHCFPGHVSDAEPARARPASKFDFQPGRTVLQVVQSHRVGLRRVGMIDPLHDLPGRGRRAACDRCGIVRARINRFDPKAVIGLADQLLERRALQHAVDQLAPVVIARRREIRR